jgi:hypothetical protein
MSIMLRLLSWLLAFDRAQTSAPAARMIASCADGTITAASPSMNHSFIKSRLFVRREKTLCLTFISQRCLLWRPR